VCRLIHLTDELSGLSQPVSFSGFGIAGVSRQHSTFLFDCFKVLLIWFYHCSLTFRASSRAQFTRKPKKVEAHLRLALGRWMLTRRVLIARHLALPARDACSLDQQTTWDRSLVRSSLRPHENFT